MKNCNKNGQKYGGPRLQEGLQMLQFCIETSLAKLLHFLAHFEYGGPYTRAEEQSSTIENTTGNITTP
jgi:hypothetical protein